MAGKIPALYLYPISKRAQAEDLLLIYLVIERTN